MNISDTLAPNSTRVNADDLITRPVVVTIQAVRRTEDAKAPLAIDLAEFPGRAWMPPVTVRRILAAVWGDETDVWIGRRVRLFNDERVAYGGKQTGGVRISHMSHMDEVKNLMLTATRGKKQSHRIEPLPDSTPTAEVQPDWHALIDRAEGDVDTLRNIYQHAQQLGESEGVLNAIKTAATNKEN